MIMMTSRAKTALLMVIVGAASACGPMDVVARGDDDAGVETPGTGGAADNGGAAGVGAGEPGSGGEADAGPAVTEEGASFVPYAVWAGIGILSVSYDWEGQNVVIEDSAGSHCRSANLQVDFRKSNNCVGAVGALMPHVSIALREPFHYGSLAIEGIEMDECGTGGHSLLVQGLEPLPLAFVGDTSVRVCAATQVDPVLSSDEDSAFRYANTVAASSDSGFRIDDFALDANQGVIRMSTEVGEVCRSVAPDIGFKVGGGTRVPIVKLVALGEEVKTADGNRTPILEFTPGKAQPYLWMAQVWEGGSSALGGSAYEFESLQPSFTCQ
jgi:hypothetical protein